MAARLKRYLKQVGAVLMVGFMLGQSSAGALSTDQQQTLSEGIYYFNTAASSCNNSNLTTTPTGSNLDYAGRPILNQAQLTAISQNQSVYQQAAQQVGIPWQMLAVIHLRESGLAVSNPGNGQGIYQFYSKQGGPYPAGPVSQDEFLRQTVLAAQFLKSIASGNYSGNQDLTANSNAATIKDTFFSYNGRAQAYAQQAAQNGFDATTQGYEGSPYVMNKADAKRDPDALGPGETTWGQIKTDGGGISYPSNSDYGAYVVYAALAGVPLSGGCSSSVNCDSGVTNAAGNLSTVRQNVVCLAQQEYQKWKSGQLTAAQGFLTYSEGRYEEWCADFASWTYDQAKYPLQPDPNWDVASVSMVHSIGMANQNFHDHANDGSYTPRPGDLGLFGGNHIVVVVGVSGKQMTTIGGDEGSGPYGTKNPPSQSIIQQDDYSNYASSGITDFVTPD